MREKVKQLIQSGEKIKRPATWHGYYLAVTTIEFWYGSKDRFHQRLKYDLIENAWQHQRLQP